MSYDLKLQTTTTFEKVTIKLVRISTVIFNKKKTSFNMKPKTRSRLILLLTFMLARHNVFASINCLSGCQHDSHSSCDASSTGCSDGEICSRFQMEEVDDGMSGEWLKIKKRTSKFQSNLFFIVKFFIT